MDYIQEMLFIQIITIICIITNIQAEETAIHISTIMMTSINDTGNLIHKHTSIESIRHHSQKHDHLTELISSEYSTIYTLRHKYLANIIISCFIIFPNCLPRIDQCTIVDAMRDHVNHIRTIIDSIQRILKALQTNLFQIGKALFRNSIITILIFREFDSLDIFL